MEHRVRVRGCSERSAFAAPRLKNEPQHSKAPSRRRRHRNALTCLARAPHQSQNALRGCPPLWSTRRRLFSDIEGVGSAHLELVMRMSAPSVIDQKHRVRAVVERKRGRGVGVPFIKSLGHWARNGFLVGFQGYTGSRVIRGCVVRVECLRLGEVSYRPPTSCM